LRLGNRNRLNREEHAALSSAGSRARAER
jgi:hypothetical protein